MVGGFEKWAPGRLAQSHMATIATGIGYGVTDLARERIAVDFMVQVRIADRQMAIGAYWCRGTFVAMGNGCVRAAFDLAVHLAGGMAVGSDHTFLAKMNIGLQIFSFVLAQEFITDPAAMASGASARHGRRASEVVAVQQAAADAGRLANVTVATAGVATGAMVAEHLLHFLMVG